MQPQLWKNPTLILIKITTTRGTEDHLELSD